MNSEKQSNLPRRRSGRQADSVRAAHTPAVRRGLCAAAAAVLSALVALGCIAPAFAVSRSEIETLRQKANSLAQEKATLSGKISALSDDITNNLEKKELLDGQISVMEDEIGNLEAQIAVYQDMIAQTEAELADAHTREEAKYAVFCERVRAMEEQGKLDYWSVLFHASSFADLLTRLDFCNEIMDADQQVIDDLKALQDEIAAKQAQQEAQMAACEAAFTELTDKKTELDSQRDAANQLIIELQASKSEAEADMDDLSEAEAEIQAEILRKSRQLAEQEAAAVASYRYSSSYNSVYNTYGYEDTTPATSGGYAWPVDSRKINSTYGGRASPGGIGSRNHKGIDIGGVGYGTPIHAAKSGTVIVSQYHYSYGNYVVVSHGSGNTTLYAHMSRRLVSVGEHVSQGATLGLTGSTGQSTGPHLHFEITENGSRVNPLQYLGGYYF